MVDQPETRRITGKLDEHGESSEARGFVAGLAGALRLPGPVATQIHPALQMP